MTPESLLDHFDHGRPWPGPLGLDVTTAYRRQLDVTALRIARGERVRGYKVGFTNRNIWPRYKVYAPVWGPVWDGTLFDAGSEGRGELDLANTCSPRIEPEAAFGFAATPPQHASLDELLASLAWVAPAFEVVQSHLDWKLTAGDAVADGSLHARLLVGPRIPVTSVGADAASFEARLAGARVRLLRGGVTVEEGVGRNVLDGPLHALHHFLREMRACPGASDIRAGDVVTTGTWTDAWPIHAGETWRAEFDAPLSPLEVRFR
jgi:2-keto-4-pentenoate hydratase